MQKLNRIFGLFLLLAFILSSCKRDGTGWDAGLVAPLATTNMTIGNLVKDTILKTNSDSSLSIVYSNTVYELNLADQFIRIPDTSIGQRYTIDSLGLPNVSIYYKISLGAMARNLIASGNGAIGQTLINQNGTYNTLPALNGLTLTPFYFSAASYFQTATFSNARLTFNVDNRLPITITDVNFELRNVNANNVILTGHYDSIPAGSSGYLGYQLQNVTIESNLAVRITSFSTPGSRGNSVLIDTSNYVGIGAYIDNLHVRDAIAIFPAQDLISLDQELTQDIAPRKFTYIDCKEGTLDVQITSAIQQPIRLTYQMKGAYNKSGQPLVATSVIPAAQNGVLSTITQSYDLNGYSINLTGANGTKFNTYTQIIKAHIDSTGLQAHISSSDSIHIQYFLRNIKPRYIKGYAGRDTISYAGNSPFSIADLFAGNSSNALRFDKASLSVSVENGIGVDGQVLINSLTGTNTNNGTSVTLTDHSSTPVIGRQLYVNKATDFPLTPRTTTFALNSATSNITDFISNLPNQISYDVKIQTNPNGNRGTYDDFAYIDSRMKVNLDINLPLSLIANNLTLRDSFNFSLGYSQKDVANIKDGVLHVILYNKFPLQSNITLVAYDSAWNKLDTLLNNAQVDAAPINGSCRATEAKKSMIDVKANADVIDKLRFAKHAIMTVVFNTRSSNATCNGQYLKIYSDYNINATITGDFNYKVKF